MKKRIEALTLHFTVKSAPSMDQLLDYPQDSLGFHVGKFLFDHSHDAEPIASRVDIYRVLINREVSNKEEIALYYYLAGNGAITIYNLIMMLAGLLFCPQHLVYFYRRYRDGKRALRFHDLELSGLLQLPLDRIQDAFLIC